MVSVPFSELMTLYRIVERSLGSIFQVMKRSMFCAGKDAAFNEIWMEPYELGSFNIAAWQSDTHKGERSSDSLRHR